MKAGLSGTGKSSSTCAGGQIIFWAYTSSFNHT